MKISAHKSALIILCIAVATAVQAGQSMTSSIQAEIKKRAEVQWPGDYSMQAYEIKNQTADFNAFQAMTKPDSMSSSTFELIKSRAERQWPMDYSMQLYELKNQVKDWMQINGR